MRCASGHTSPIPADIPRNILKRGCEIFRRVCVRAQRPKRKRDTTRKSPATPAYRSPVALAVTNYINADGTSRAIAVFTARLRAPWSRRHTAAPHQRRRGKRLRGRRNMAGPRRGDHRITGHQSRESPASRRESATAPEAANPPPSSRFLCSFSFFLRPPPFFTKLRRPLLSIHP